MTFRKLAITTLSICALLGGSNLWAVDCTPDDIDLSSQLDVDNFQTDHGPCDHVVGTLWLDGADITNVDGLSAVKSVGGSLIFFQTTALADIDGLSALTSVGGGLFFTLCDALTNINGLSALTSVGGSLTVQFSGALTNLDGFSALTDVGLDLQIDFNVGLIDVDGLSSLTSVGDTFVMSFNPALGRCQGLVKLLDQHDDAAPGPGPGPGGVPDVGGDVFLINNLPGCNSIEEILLSLPTSVPMLNTLALLLMASLLVLSAWWRLKTR